jgi:hypothetical protein
MLELVRTRAEPRRVVREEPDRAIDEPHAAVWDAIRHFFPAHAMVTQTDYGYMLVSWSLRGDRRASTHFAAPIVIRIEPGLLLALWTCDPEDRESIAREQAECVREQLAGYDPRARVPTCGVVIIGE